MTWIKYDTIHYEIEVEFLETKPFDLDEADIDFIDELIEGGVEEETIKVYNREDCASGVLFIKYKKI